MKALGAGYFASSDFASVIRRLPGPLVLPEALRGAAAYRGGKKKAGPFLALPSVSGPFLRKVGQEVRLSASTPSKPGRGARCPSAAHWEVSEPGPNLVQRQPLS